MVKEMINLFLKKIVKKIIYLKECILMAFNELFSLVGGG